MTCRNHRRAAADCLFPDAARAACNEYRRTRLRANGCCTSGQVRPVCYATLALAIAIAWVEALPVKSRFEDDMKRALAGAAQSGVLLTTRCGPIQYEEAGAWGSSVGKPSAASLLLCKQSPNNSKRLVRGFESH